MKRTPRNVIHILERSGRLRVNERQLTKFRQERLLPPLKRGVREGTNEPENAWTEPNIVRQVALLHDLLVEWSHRHKLLYLPMWLLGFDVPFERVRPLFLTSVEYDLQAFLPEETDPDDEMDFQISSIVYHMMERWKHDPWPSNMFKQYGSTYCELIAEFMLNMFANPAYEIDSQALMALLEGAPKSRGVERSGQVHISALQQELDPAILNIARVVQEVTSLSKVRDVMADASEKEWEKAREDFQTLISHVCTIFNASLSLSGRSLSLPLWFKFNILVKTAFFSFPVLLSMQRKGYGHWIDVAMTELEEFNTFIEHWLTSGEQGAGGDST